MPPFFVSRSTGKARRVWGDLSRGDRTLIGRLVAITTVSVVVLLAASRHAEKIILESDSDQRSARTVEFLHDNLSNLPDLLVSGRPTVDDLTVFRHALQMGEAFRYKLYDAQGQVIVASRQEDIGKRNTEAYFDEIIREGRSFFRVDRRPSAGIFADALGVSYGEEASVVGKRYVPITHGREVQGVIEVYLDLTALDQRLHRNSQWILVGLLAMLGLVCGASAASLRGNIRDRRRAMEQLGEARHRAETLSRQAKRMLDDLFASEEEKMSRIVGLVDGISHEIGNPLATLNIGLDALEAHCHQLDHEDCDARLNDMRVALTRVGGFLHRLSALSLEDGETEGDVDVNEILRNLAGLVQLSDRTCDVVFALHLPPDIAPLSLPRRSVSLSLFIILSAAAERVDKAGGRIEIESRMSATGDAVELQIAATDDAPTSSPPQAPSTSSPESDHPALATARRMIESLGGHMVLSSETPGAHHFGVTLPLLSQSVNS